MGFFPRSDGVTEEVLPRPIVTGKTNIPIEISPKITPPPITQTSENLAEVFQASAKLAAMDTLGDNIASIKSAFDFEDGKMVQPEQINSEIPDLESPVNIAMTRDSVERLKSRHEEKKFLSGMIQAGPHSYTAKGTAFAAGMIAHATDPLELGTAVVGAGAFGWAAKAGYMGTRLASLYSVSRSSLAYEGLSLGRKVAQEFGRDMAGNLIIEPFSAAGRRAEYESYNAADSLAAMAGLTLGINGVLGGAGHFWAGHYRMKGEAIASERYSRWLNREQPNLSVDRSGTPDTYFSKEAYRSNGMDRLALPAPKDPVALLPDLSVRFTNLEKLKTLNDAAYDMVMQANVGRAWNDKAPITDVFMDDFFKEHEAMLPKGAAFGGKVPIPEPANYYFVPNLENKTLAGKDFFVASNRSSRNFEIGSHKILDGNTIIDVSHFTDDPNKANTALARKSEQSTGGRIYHYKVKDTMNPLRLVAGEVPKNTKKALLSVLTELYDKNAAKIIMNSNNLDLIFNRVEHMIDADPVKAYLWRKIHEGAQKDGYTGYLKHSTTFLDGREGRGHNILMPFNNDHLEFIQSFRPNREHIPEPDGDLIKGLLESYNTAMSDINYDPVAHQSLLDAMDRPLLPDPISLPDENNYSTDFVMTDPQSVSKLRAEFNDQYRRLDALFPEGMPEGLKKSLTDTINTIEADAEGMKALVKCRIG